MNFQGSSQQSMQYPLSIGSKKKYTDLFHTKMIFSTRACKFNHQIIYF